MSVTTQKIDLYTSYFFFLFLFLLFLCAEYYYLDLIETDSYFLYYIL